MLTDQCNVCDLKVIGANHITSKYNRTDDYAGDKSLRRREDTLLSELVLGEMACVRDPGGRVH